MNDTGKIPQCDRCSAALLEGYCEMVTALTEERQKLCFSCARLEMKLKRALDEDDADQQG